MRELPFYDEIGVSRLAKSPYGPLRRMVRQPFNSPLRRSTEE